MKFHLSKLGANWGLKQKASRKLTRKLGISGRSKWMRQLKRGFKNGFSSGSLSTSQPVSASTVGYQHNARTLSQLTGGV